MATSLKFKRTKIESCSLHIFPEPESGDYLESYWKDATPESTLDITRFDITYEIDQSPTASVSLGFGASFFSKKRDVRLPYSDLIEGAPCEIWLYKTSPGDREWSSSRLFRGFISRVSLTDNGVSQIRRIGVTLEIAHVSSILGGVPSSSYVLYGSENPEHVDLFTRFEYLRGLSVQNFLPANASSDTRFKTDPSFAPKLGQFPGRAILFFAESLQKEFKRGDGSLAKDLIKVYDPSNLKHIADIDGSTVFSFLGEIFINSWKSGNTLSAIYSCARAIGMNVIPHLKGIYLASAYPLDRTSGISLGPSEYSSVVRVTSFNKAKNVDGIILTLTLPSFLPGDALTQENAFYFPKDAENKPLKNKFYHVRTFPQWLTKVTLLDTGGVSQENINQIERGLAEKVSRMLYAYEFQKKGAMVIRVPFREDLMPGTIIQIEKDSSNTSSPIQSNYFGRIDKTIISGEAGQGGEPFLHMDLTISSTRTEDDNKKDDITIDGNPIYEGGWAGVKLNGELLAEPKNYNKYQE